MRIRRTRCSRRWGFSEPGRPAVSTSPLLLTAKDPELLGVANKSDPMGTLAIWSARGRDLVPHLTEQTTNVRGFQLLVEAFRLWEVYEPAHPAHAGRLPDFFLLVEQAFARIAGYHRKAWTLPGSRRVRARSTEAPHISITEHSWHLLGGQRANGVWGLYRGASQRAGLLEDNLTQLSAKTRAACTARPCLSQSSQRRLFQLAEAALDGKTVPLPAHLNGQLAKELLHSLDELPLADHLHAHLVASPPLNAALANRLPLTGVPQHRPFLLLAAAELTDHAATLEDVLRCENLLAPLEAIFLTLCASRGQSVADVASSMKLDLAAIEDARAAFADSGIYRGKAARTRQEAFQTRLDTRSAEALARSVLQLHSDVSEQRSRAVWAWEDAGLLRSDVDAGRPTDDERAVGGAFRNDYYLAPLAAITQQLAAVRG